MNKPNNYLSFEEIEAGLRKLKLSGMADTLRDVTDNPKFQGLNFEERLGMLVYHELEIRREKRTERCLQRSGLKTLEPFSQAQLSKLIKSRERNLDVELLERLMTCRWIEDGGKNLLINGPTGTGKTWVLSLLGQAACNRGIRVLYLRFNRLEELIEDAYRHSESAKFRHQLNAYQLLIIDDLGTYQMRPETGSALLAILDERIGNSSVAIASQLPFEEWHNFLGNNLNADAIVDRLFNSGYKMSLKGRSLRERKKSAQE